MRMAGCRALRPKRLVGDILLAGLQLQACEGCCWHRTHWLSSGLPQLRFFLDL